jgi:hypothetical protein
VNNRTDDVANTNRQNNGTVDIIVSFKIIVIYQRSSKYETGAEVLELDSLNLSLVLIEPDGWSPLILDSSLNRDDVIPPKRSRHKDESYCRKSFSKIGCITWELVLSFVIRKFLRGCRGVRRNMYEVNLPAKNPGEFTPDELRGRTLALLLCQHQHTSCCQHQLAHGLSLAAANQSIGSTKATAQIQIERESLPP